MKKLFFLFICLWSAAWMWGMRHHFLDDAFINLRHAELLAQKGFITFDGLHRTDGISSLLGVSLVALFYKWSGSVFVLKATSIAYFSGLIILFFRKWRKSRGAAQLLWASLILVSISPFGLRWLTDGMETGLVLLNASFLALALHRISGKDSLPPFAYGAFAVWGFLLILLRIEFAFVITMGTLAIVFSNGGGLRRLVSHSHLGVGMIFGFLAARFLTGEFIPDPAIAKTIGHVSFSHGFYAILAALKGGLSFGAGLCINAVLSGILALILAVKNRKGAVPVLWVNSLLLAVYLVTSLRGQEVQGIRHVLWCFYFVMVWNIEAVSRLSSGEVSLFRRLLFVLCGAWFAVWPFEAKMLSRIIQSRSESFLAMRSQPLRALAGLPGIAFDIGTIAYFSKARICDMMGVVNGREVARMPKEERMAWCKSWSPVFVFATVNQASYVSKSVSMEGWPVCFNYTFHNLRTSQSHYLFVSPDLQPSVCPQPLGRLEGRELIFQTGKKVALTP